MYNLPDKLRRDADNTSIKLMTYVTLSSSSLATLQVYGI